MRRMDKVQHDPIIPEADIPSISDNLTPELAEAIQAIMASGGSTDCARWFKNYLLFTHHPQLLEQAEYPLSPEDRLYNRYYWFVKFVRARERAIEYDAGLEQQAFQLLEGSDTSFDWAVIADLEIRIDAELNSSSL